MAVQPVTQNVQDYAHSRRADAPGSFRMNNLLKERPSNRPAAGGSAAVSFSSTSYSSDSMLLEYMNKDGDSVTLRMEHVEYQEAMLAAGGDADAGYWKDVVEKITDEFLTMKENIIRKVLASLEGEEGGGEVEQAEPKEIEGLPEYWNAENTSQRIVDFATSFYGLTQCGGKEYYDMMRGAIEQGYTQAMGMLGEMPDEVSNLSKRTYELALQKLEAWAVEAGIDLGGQAEAAA